MKVLIFIYGLLIGSFVNVLIYRIPRDENIAWPSSHCPHCNTNLKWYDNIPLFSYLLLKGKCRYCKKRISIQYPIIESLNAFIYLILFFYFDYSLEFIFYSLVFSIIIAILVIDLKEMIIPDILVVTILILSILYKALNYFIWGISPQIVNSLGGMFIAGGMFLLILILSRGGMGEGDIALIGVFGFILGIKMILLVIFLSFILGSIISIFLLITRVKTRKDPIPFGPFIVLGFFIVIFAGDELLNLYLNILF